MPPYINRGASSIRGSIYKDYTNNFLSFCTLNRVLVKERFNVAELILISISITIDYFINSFLILVLFIASPVYSLATG